jgi:2'-5' RNA ligase
MVRTFLALELSEDIRQQLTSAQDVLRECRSRLTFVDPSLIHITVKFLGEVDEKDIPKIIDAIKAIRFSPFPVHAGVVTVNSPRSPRTVWCAIGDNREGERLFTLVEDALEPLGFARETRRFTPHATVARVKLFDPSLFRQLDLLKGKTY